MKNRQVWGNDPKRQEVWFLGDKVIYQGPCNYSEEFSSAEWPKFSYAFYDTRTGEVWGKRVVLDGTLWHYSPGSPPDMRLPWEEREYPILPDEIFENYLDWLMEHKQ